MMKNKSEKVIEFEKKIAGTLIAILDLVSAFCMLLIAIAIFLPIVNIDILGESIGIFDFSDASSVGLLMNLIIIFLASSPTFIINKFRNDFIDGKNDKQKLNKIIFIISIAQFVLVVLFVILNLPVSLVSGVLEISTEFISAGAGTIIIYVTGIINSLIVLVKTVFLIGVLNEKLELKRIINIKKGN